MIAPWLCLPWTCPATGVTDSPPHHFILTLQAATATPPGRLLRVGLGICRESKAAGDSRPQGHTALQAPPATRVMEKSPGTESCHPQACPRAPERTLRLPSGQSQWLIHDWQVCCREPAPDGTPSCLCFPPGQDTVWCQHSSVTGANTLQSLLPHSGTRCCLMGSWGCGPVGPKSKRCV